MSDLPPEVEEIVAKRSERGVVWQLGGCFGCLGLVVLLFLLLAQSFLRADRETQIDPAAAEANLAQIVECKIPNGYRGFRGIAREGRRIAVVTPHTHSGLDVPLSGRLTLSVWTFQGTPDTKEVRTYWEGKLREAWKVETLSPKDESESPVRVRGAERRAQTLTYEGGPKKTRVRLLLLTLPRKKGSEEQIAVAGIGGEERFDTAAWTAFLESIQ